ncbi:beta-ketoacyl synthase N-terminal-like domain-containing protein [Streptomyces rapamycinicus]|uniref:Beta-ketoacyl synthase n=2 Tax=Streptomyces rapamycinicus TaxID=1226757 RepID=A0A0A0NKR6_STRRN|nr:beta-ketoacyl synthase N-terminal-like domain-containing protein [Streptomyces rapamycinicus]AGP57559.1 beta-ketoacyl synthase [Streptomyces rapamycinicus NRRL 5491]MBB4785219.1 3-oxoacyl-[acyl-carrier-protein] synthase II [Streptomyces rapamycinicus]RLV79309.1 beta-ketoacyl synthase [Streptomyces rapamycinicus NRRL 5491]UTO65429.1 beta-ketoacyl synthase [Streptomyces rapamycinicus]UTP33385.1 beta-ketoacyl synthase [Streptomyces rapamycinicus NRRL 5491]
MTHGPGGVVVTGVGLAVPGAGTPEALLRRTACPVTGPAPEPFDTAARIGRRGHRYKDRATRLALCAALEALRNADLIPADGEEVTVPGDTVGVVASSNLGNLDTACLTAAAIAERSAVDLSPMSLPNASSNVIASWVAIRHGLRGPNLMLCNGATSGLDAVHWGAALVAAGRVRRAVVIGVETHNAVVADLVGRPAGELLDGAAAVVVEGARWAGARGARAAAALGPYERRAGLGGCVEALLPDGAAPGVWFTPERYAEGPAGAVPVPGAVPRYDVTGAVGRASGALGVFQCAAAVGWLARAGAGAEAGAGAGPEAGAGSVFEAAGPGAAPGPVPASRQALITSGDDTADAVAGLLLRPAPDRCPPRPARAPLISMECSR